MFPVHLDVLMESQDFYSKCKSSAEVSRVERFVLDLKKVENNVCMEYVVGVEKFNFLEDECNNL